MQTDEITRKKISEKLLQDTKKEKETAKGTVSNDGHLRKVSKAQGHLVKQQTVRTTDQRVTV